MTDKFDSGRVNVLVSLSREAIPEAEDIVEKAESAGLVVDQVMERVGTIAGHAPATALSSIQSIPGVRAVEEERTVSAI